MWRGHGSLLVGPIIVISPWGAAQNDLLGFLGGFRVRVVGLAPFLAQNVAVLRGDVSPHGGFVGIFVGTHSYVVAKDAFGRVERLLQVILDLDRSAGDVFSVDESLVKFGGSGFGFGFRIQLLVQIWSYLKI